MSTTLAITNVPSVIAITGLKRAGKDTVGKYFADSLAARGYGEPAIIQFSTPLKIATSALLGIDTQTLEMTKDIVDDYWSITPRRFMEWLGTDVLQSADIPMIVPDRCFFVKSMLRKSLSATTIITDMRFPHEFDYVKSVGGIVIKVINSRCVAADTIPEQSALALGSDYTISNDGTFEELFDKCDLLIEELFKK